LLEEAASDTSTILGAELANWAYPASMRDLLTLAGTIGDWKAARKVMPWVMENPRRGAQRDQATPAEIAAADAELESEFVFTS
jgi:hypothetical protein